MALLGHEVNICECTIACEAILPDYLFVGAAYYPMDCCSCHEAIILRTLEVNIPKSTCYPTIEAYARNSLFFVHMIKEAQNIKN